VSAWLTHAADVAILLLAVAMLLCMVRLLRGPDIEDRILALDTLYVNALALLIVLGVRLAEPTFYEAALLIGMLGFVGTVALARFLLRGDIIE
jgi:multicomponent K+:H+ antiporter subunit F